MSKPFYFYIVTLVTKSLVSRDLNCKPFDTEEEAKEFVENLFGEGTVYMLTEYRNFRINRQWFSHANIVAGIGAGWCETDDTVMDFEEVLANA